MRPAPHPVALGAATVILSAVVYLIISFIHEGIALWVSGLFMGLGIFSMNDMYGTGPKPREVPLGSKVRAIVRLPETKGTIEVVGLLSGVSFPEGAPTFQVVTEDGHLVEVPESFVRRLDDLGEVNVGE